MDFSEKPSRTVPFGPPSEDFSSYVSLIKAADGLSLGQVCAITGLEPSTIQNWIKRGFVPRPVRKKYRERQLARILMISCLRDCMRIDSIGELLAAVNGDTEDESDDLIPEDRLYCCLCAVLKAAGNDRSAESISDAVVKATENVKTPDEKAGDRLRGALTVMAYAYISGKYKYLADSLFCKIKEDI